MKIAVSGFLLAGFLIGIWLIKAGLEEIFIGDSAIMSPKTALLFGITILVFSWLRFKKKA